MNDCKHENFEKYGQGCTHPGTCLKCSENIYDIIRQQQAEIEKLKSIIFLNENHISKLVRRNNELWSQVEHLKDEMRSEIEPRDEQA